jgi:hypothetical protein
MATATHSGRRSRYIRAAALALLATGATVVGTGLAGGSAQAKMYDGQWRDETSYDDSFVQCGLNIDLSGTWTAQGNQRVGTGSQAGLFPGISNYEYTDTWTNADNGEYFTIHANGTAVQSASHNLGGTLWEGTFRTQENLQVIDESGTVVLRDAGQTQQVQVFDDTGDNAPGATLISEIVRDVGHQSLANMTPDEICDGILDLIG